MNEVYNLANLRDQFTLNKLKKIYNAQKEETISIKLVVKVLSRKKPLMLQKKNYLVFMLSDDVTTIPALLLHSEESLEQQKILEYSLKEREPLILENPKKILSTIAIPFAIEISLKIPPIGTTIEPIKSYNKQEIEYFFVSNNKKRTKHEVVNNKPSPFVTASDLLKTDAIVNNLSPFSNTPLLSSEEIIDYFKNNSSKWTANFSSQSKNLQNNQFGKISYIIEYAGKRTKNFSSNIKFVALNKKTDTWIQIFDITIQEKDFYNIIKKNLDVFSSMQTLQSLVNIEV